MLMGSLLTARLSSAVFESKAPHSVRETKLQTKNEKPHLKFVPLQQLKNRSSKCSLLLVFIGQLLYQQTMGTGTTSAQHGRTPLDHGNCTKMARLRLQEKALIKVVVPPYVL